MMFTPKGSQYEITVHGRTASSVEAKTKDILLAILAQVSVIADGATVLERTAGPYQDKHIALRMSLSWVLQKSHHVSSVSLHRRISPCQPREQLAGWPGRCSRPELPRTTTGSSGHTSPADPGAMTEVHRLAKAPGTLLASTTSRVVEPLAPAKCSTAWILDGSASWYCLRACSTVTPSLSPRPCRGPLQ